MQLQSQLLLVALVALTSSCAASGRHLLHSKQPDAKPCVYYPASAQYYGYNASACAANDEYTLGLTRAQLNTPAARVYASWRGSVDSCASHVLAAACGDDTANFCAFNFTSATCNVSPNLMPYLYSCAGEFAQAYYNCRVLGDTSGADGCGAGPGCYWDSDFASVGNDGNACFVYDILAENNTPARLEDWVSTNLMNFLEPVATAQIYGSCPASLSFQQAGAYAATCAEQSDAATCAALDCRVSSAPLPGSNSTTCAPLLGRYNALLVGGAPAQLLYKQWALCPRLDNKPTSCANFEILYTDRR